MKILALSALLLGLLLPRMAFAADVSIAFTPCASACTNTGAVTGANGKLYPTVTLGDGTNPDTQKLAIDSSGRLTLVPGFATSAKQPALGTVGSPSSDVLTTQPPNNPGIGALVAGSTITPTTNGASLGSAPTGMTGVRFYLASGASVVFTIATSAPGAPPTTFTASCCGAGTSGPNWDESLGGNALPYIVTGTTGTWAFRWR